MERHGQIQLNVLITTYNHERYIEDTLIGAINQRTNFKFNIIVHDDASTDNTQEILKRYQSEFPNIITLVLQKENLFSNNVDRYPYIKKYITAQYIARCEGDDYWIDFNKLQKQVDFLEKNKDYYAVYHNVLTVDENHRISQNKFYKITPSKTYDLIKTIHASLPSQTASIVSRNYYIDSSPEFLSDLRNIKTNGDTKLANVFALKGNIYKLADIMAVHRKIYSFGDSYTARTHEKNKSLDKYIGLLDLENFVNKYNSQKLTNIKTRRYLIYRIVKLRLLKPSAENKLVFNKLKKHKKDSILLSLFIISFKFPIRVTKGIFRRLLFLNN